MARSSPIINDAFAISHDGWILAYGHYGDDRLNDPCSWLLLRSVTEPDVLLLAASGVAILGHRRKDRP